MFGLQNAMLIGGTPRSKIQYGAAITRLAVVLAIMSLKLGNIENMDIGGGISFLVVLCAEIVLHVFLVFGGRHI